jgi:hypothetical protein
MSRRRILAGMTTGAAALAATTLLPRISEASAPTAAPRKATSAHRNAVWVWAFSEDGRDPVAVRDMLAAHGLDVIFKTHDGAEWTTRADGTGVAGPEDVRKWADFFESAGVGFHAWYVTRGVNPVREGEMVVEALNSGARSMYIDLETPEGRFYWHGSDQDALTIGQTVRGLKPDARILIAPDARPWKVKEVPLREFASWADGIAPQLYWEIFNSPANFKLLADYGYHAGPNGMTPELVLDAANGALAQFGLPVHPIGGGAARLDEWHRFVSHAYSLGMPAVSVWRYGTAVGGLWPALQSMPAPQPAPAPTPEPTPAVVAPPPAQPAATPPPQAASSRASLDVELEKDTETVDSLTVEASRARERLSDDWRTLGSQRNKR